MSHEHHRRHQQTDERREVIYYLRPSRPLADAAGLPYTDVIVAFLSPTSSDDLTLRLTDKRSDFLTSLPAAIQALHAAGKHVLVSFGGSSRGFPTSAYQSYANDVAALVDQLVNWVETYGFDGIDIDYEDSAGFYEGAYDGKAFLIELTSSLASRLPAQQSIITHAPQPPFWDPRWRHAGAPYQQIWSEVGQDISWLNNQFYNNPEYDATPALQTYWYGTIAGVTGANKLLFGANLYPGSKSGYLDAPTLVAEVIQPLRAAQSSFGGVMGWEMSFDTDGSWGATVAQALA